MASNEAYVLELPLCDFCLDNTKALYDGRTNLGFWAYMCEEHFTERGVGLGLGRGQKLLIVRQL